MTINFTDSIEFLRRCNDIGIQIGHQRRTKELVTWLRKRRHIRREELLGFLAGKSPPPKSSHIRLLTF